MAKAKETQVKTETAKEQAKEIKLDFLMMCRQRAEIYKREEMAREYCAEVRRQKERKRGMLANAIVLGVILVCMVMMFVNANNRKMESETQGRTYIMQDELKGR